VSSGRRVTRRGATGLRRGARRLARRRTHRCAPGQ
jgi:hypothetical protein